MDEIKKISLDEIKLIAAEKGFSEQMIIKDYFITVLLYLIKDIKGIYFKGGTALQKIFLNYSRISEDIDFTVERDIVNLKKEIELKILDSKIFSKIYYDKDVLDFTRIVVEYEMFNENGLIFIDLNKRAKLLKKPAKYEIKNFYDFKTFFVNCESKEEMIAGKVAAAIGRNKPRDHYDIYKLIKEGHNFDYALIKKKCKLSGFNFDLNRMFNNAKKLYNKWNTDLNPLLTEEVEFEEVIKTLSKFFRVKS